MAHDASFHLLIVAILGRGIQCARLIDAVGMMMMVLLGRDRGRVDGGARGVNGIVVTAGSIDTGRVRMVGVRMLVCRVQCRIGVVVHAGNGCVVLVLLLLLRRRHLFTSIGCSHVRRSLGILE